MKVIELYIPDTQKDYPHFSPPKAALPTGAIHGNICSFENPVGPLAVFSRLNGIASCRSVVGSGLYTLLTNKADLDDVISQIVTLQRSTPAKMYMSFVIRDASTEEEAEATVKHEMSEA